jgi:hypothetical protein
MKVIHIVFIIISLRLFTLNVDVPLFSYIAPALLGALFLVHIFQNPKAGIEALACKINYVHLGMGFVFFMSVLVTLSNNMNLLASISFLLRYFVIFWLCYFGFVYARNPEGTAMYKWFIVLLIVLNVAALTSLVGLGRVELVDGVKRPVGFVGFSEVMSHLSLFSVLFSCYIYLNEKTKLKVNWRVANILLLLVAVLSLFASSTLKNILMLPPAMFLLLLFSGVSFFKLIRFSFAFFILLFPLVMLMGGHLIERIEQTVNVGVDLDIAEGDAVQSSFAFRVLHWKLLLTDWYSNYFYFGGGIENVQNMKGFGYYRGLRLDAHSDIVKLICELGLFGIIIFSIFYIKLLLLLNRLRHFTSLAGFCICCILTFSVVASSGKVFFSAFNLYLMPLLIGYCFGQVKYRGYSKLCVV